MRRLILRTFQSPGDVVMLTAAVRDLHQANPQAFQTDVRTSADALWQHNPHLTLLREGESGVEVLDMHYPLVHHSNERPYHFIHGYAQYLEEQLGVRVPLSRFHGEIFLSDQEKQIPPPGAEQGLPERYWILMAGGKYDFTAKWWNPDSYQAVVDHFAGKIHFVQCGEKDHWHPPLTGVTNLIGKTSLRDFVRLMYHADGVVCPVTFAMHLAAAVESKRGPRGTRPCVVIAGGREPTHWEAYPTHQCISTVGALSCCRTGGCWKSRCQPVGDGDEKDRTNLCEQPVQVKPDLRIPRCMEMISAAEVIRRIELYYQGGMLDYQPAGPRSKANGHALSDTPPPARPPLRGTDLMSVKFYHGLGDCAYFAHLIPLYARRGHAIEVECTPDKRLLFEAAGARVVSTASQNHPWGYPDGNTYEGHGRFWQGSKMGHNISEAPLPNIGPKEELWEEYCNERIEVGPRLMEARDQVRRWLEKLPRPITLLHSKGNTAQDRKSLPDSIVSQFYRSFLDQCDGTLILLDWDNRVPRLDSYRVRHLEDLGACPADVLMALMCEANLMVGVDSGPLHVARFTQIPTIGVWMPGHYPSTYSLPRHEQLNVVLSDHTRQWNRFKRIPWNIVEHPGGTYRADRLADLCRKMLAEPRYLTRQHIAADVQLQQFVQEFCRCQDGTGGYWDRHRSFDLVLRETSQRFERPTIVETGTIRAEEDWPGAGFFTYLGGAYVHRRGGRLISVDLTGDHVNFARQWTAIFGSSVQVVQQDSVAYLRSFTEPIDVLYLDSLDATEPGHAEHCLRELEAAAPRLGDRSLIVIDDTPWRHRAWTGKGALAAPWLLQNGWRLLYGGYQLVFSR